MPAKYEAIRDKIHKELVKKGVKDALAKAKTSAARIYNSQRGAGEKPVTGKSD